MGKVNNRRKNKFLTASARIIIFWGLLQLFSFSGLYSPQRLAAVEGLPASVGPGASDRRLVLEWKYATGGRVLAMTAGRLNPNRLYVLSEDRRLYCLRGDGTLLWRSERLPARPHPFLRQSPDGTLYLSMEPSTIAAYTPTGRPVWIRSTSAAEQTTEWMLPGPDGLIFAFAGNTLTLRTHTGYLVWRETLAVEAAIPPVADEHGSLWTVSLDGHLLRIDATGPASLAQLDVRYQSTSGPAGQSSLRIAADHSGVAVAAGKNMWFFNQAGDLKWDADLYSPAEDLGLDEKRVYIRTAGNRIAAVDRGSGEELWTALLPMESAEILAGRGRSVLVYNNRMLELYRAADGAPQFSAPIPVPAAPPQMLAADQLIVGGADWVLYSFRSPFFRPRAPQEETVQDGGAGESGPAVRAPRMQPTLEEVILNEASRAEHLLLVEELSERAGTIASSKNYPELLSLLSQLAGVGVLDPVRRRGVYINDFPEVRRKAVELLGRIGSLQSQNHLLMLLQYEWDPQVHTALFAAIGNLQSGLGGKVVRTFLSMIKNGRLKIDEEPLMTAELIRCIRKISLYGGTVRPAAGEILMDIYLSDAPRSLRMQAIRTLREIGTKPQN